MKYTLKTTAFLFFNFAFLLGCNSKKSDVDDFLISYEPLKNQLEHIYFLDQGVREVFSKDLSENRKMELLLKFNLFPDVFEDDEKIDFIKKIDSINLVAVEKIISENGYPSKELVGDIGSRAVFNVLEHSSSQILEKYFPILVEAQKNGEISKASLAMIEDKILMYRGKPQIYGTQIRKFEDENGKLINFLWPLDNPELVDAKRNNALFYDNLNEYLVKRDVVIAYYSLEDVSKFNLH